MKGSSASQHLSLSPSPPFQTYFADFQVIFPGVTRPYRLSLSCESFACSSVNHFALGFRLFGESGSMKNPVTPKTTVMTELMTKSHLRYGCQGE